MAENLRWVLILISAVVIGGLLVHGLWSVRKRSQAVENKPAKAKPQPKAEPHEPHNTQDTVSRSEPEPTSVQHDEPSFGAIDDEPSIGEINIDDEPAAAHEETEANSDSEQPAEDFVIIHVHMPEGLQMQGAKLLPLVLTLGFKYSDDGFFHRHEQASGQGPVLFRMVNMYNPGTFDVDNMEQFSTAGVSLFMTLPNDGEAMATFNMLHSAAKKVADEFGAELLDHNRQPLSVSTVREYVEKVREYA
ncbi:cell division protein ZipA [Pseudoalteromonas sp. Cnat2-41]|uniref:cell division protein ZipA n=1 Tax=Pseudoalteromonas TaxID=53246 RepID=UPI0011084659|nr:MULTISPECIES: cell division protein ZipA [Pseudoalteromonas]MCF2863619.1 cell division protein ZipA [Pseudoalteromonas sp. CNAT2-18]MCG7558572.1 cell division protein ZipA [Pseudoalteromonas sp. CNAT2-18.1]TLX50781.1 cell division protein ZipA [Pseudoalteromonas ruthenica]